MWALSPDSHYRNMVESNSHIHDERTADGDCTMSSGSDRISKAETSSVNEPQRDVPLTIKSVGKQAANVPESSNMQGLQEVYEKTNIDQSVRQLFLDKSEPLPDETKKQIYLMAVGTDWGYSTIAKQLRTADGMMLSKSRVRSYLESINMALNSNRELAALGLKVLTLPGNERIPEDIKNEILTMAVRQNVGPAFIAKKIRLSDGTQLTKGRVKMFLESRKLATKVQRANAIAAAKMPLSSKSTQKQTVDFEMTIRRYMREQTDNPATVAPINHFPLRPKEDIPAETKAQIVSMAIKNKWGYCRITKRIRSSSTRIISKSRVSSFLTSLNLNTKAQRELAAKTLNSQPLLQTEAIPDERKAEIPSTTRQNTSGSTLIAREVSYSDRRQIIPTRVRSLLKSNQLRKKALYASASAGEVDGPSNNPSPLGSHEVIPEDIKAQIRSLFINEQWSFKKISNKIILPDKRTVPVSRVESYLTSINLNTNAQRHVATLGLNAPPLLPNQEIPEEIKVGILSMAILNNFGSRKIAGRLRLIEGRQIPLSRVKWFLESENLETKALRAKAAAALDPGTLPWFQPIPEETKKHILSLATQANLDAIGILKRVRLPDGKQLTIDRVRSLLESSGLKTSPEHAITTLSALPTILPPSEDSLEWLNFFNDLDA